MVERVHGTPVQGVWVEKDVKFISVTSTNGTFLEDLLVRDGTDPVAVDSGLEQVLEAVATRATVLGFSVASATVVHVMVGHAGAFTAGNTQATSGSVEAALAAAIDAVSTPNLTSTAIATHGGFTAAALGTAV